MTAKPRRAPRPRKAAESSEFVPEGFYRDLVWNLRNGVMAITRDGRIAVMNEVAYRTLGVKPTSEDIGRHYSDVLKNVPDVCRIMSSAFDLSHLPNRAELRLRTTGKVMTNLPLLQLRAARACRTRWRRFAFPSVRQRP